MCMKKGKLAHQLKLLHWFYIKPKRRHNGHYQYDNVLINISITNNCVKQLYVKFHIALEKCLNLRGKALSIWDKLHFILPDKINNTGLPK
jgi:hypothetical protein